MKNLEMFNQQLTGMGEVFNKAITPALAQIYWTSLKEFTDEQVKTAFEQALGSLKFFPKPSELREIIQGTGDEHGHEAWSEIMFCLERGKPPPEELHHITRSLGGWGNLKLKTYKDLEFVKRDFMEIYVAQDARGELENRSITNKSLISQK